MEKLDLKDRKILFELEQDSRQSLNQLAKKVRLKKETIFHRIKNLEKRGIIKLYLTEIDVYKLGYFFYPILLRYENTTPEIEEEVYDYLSKSKYIAWLAKCDGAWDINLTLITKGSLQLNEFLNEFLEKYSQYIAERHIFTTTEIHYFKRDFWLDKPTTKTVSTSGEKTIEIDEMNYKLLKILATYARKPLLEIGRELKTHPKSIAYRIKKLEKQKIIQGSRILVDFTKIGYKYYKIWFSLKNMNEDNFRKLITYFRHHPNIVWATKTIGYYDLSIEIEVKDVEEFRKIVDEIKERFSVLIKKHESLMIFEEEVMNYLPQI